MRNILIYFPNNEKIRTQNLVFQYQCHVSKFGIYSLCRKPKNVISVWTEKIMEADRQGRIECVHKQAQHGRSSKGKAFLSMFSCLHDD